MNCGRKPRDHEGIILMLGKRTSMHWVQRPHMCVSVNVSVWVCMNMSVCIYCICEHVSVSECKQVCVYVLPEVYTDSSSRGG